MNTIPTTKPPSDIKKRVSNLDISLFDAIPSETTSADKRSLLAVQRAVSQKRAEYVYLEIGSHLGGSIQSHCVDPRCRKIYSVDPRPPLQSDDRSPGCSISYEGNSTERMLGLLSAIDGADLTKVECFELDAAEIDPNDVREAPDIAFIDGMHTKEAAISDFRFCRQVVNPDGIILFHDFGIVFEAIADICKALKKEKIPHAAFLLEGSVFGVFLCPELVTEDGYLGNLFTKNGGRLRADVLRRRIRRLVPEVLLKTYRLARAWLKRK